MEISYRKTNQGAWELATICNEQLISRQYMGHTRKEATRLFKEYVKEGK
jgi:hypothetical protein